MKSNLLRSLSLFVLMLFLGIGIYLLWLPFFQYRDAEVVKELEKYEEQTFKQFKLAEAVANYHLQIHENKAYFYNYLNAAARMDSVAAYYKADLQAANKLSEHSLVQFNDYCLKQCLSAVSVQPNHTVGSIDGSKIPAEFEAVYLAIASFLQNPIHTTAAAHTHTLLYIILMKYKHLLSRAMLIGCGFNFAPIHIITPNIAFPTVGDTLKGELCLFTSTAQNSLEQERVWVNEEALSVHTPHIQLFQTDYDKPLVVDCKAFRIHKNTDYTLFYTPISVQDTFYYSPH